MEKIIEITNTESTRTKRGRMARAILAYYANQRSFRARLNREAMLDVEEESEFTPVLVKSGKCRSFSIINLLKELLP